MNRRMEELTKSELLVMKTIWESEDPLSLGEITERVNRCYKKQWKEQTVSTFLRNIIAKGYLKMYRHSRTYLYDPLVEEKFYEQQELSKFLNFWNDGRVDRLFASLTEVQKLTKEEKEHIKELLDGME